MSEYVVHESKDGFRFNTPVEKITRCRDCSNWPCEWNWDEEEPDGFCSWARPKGGHGSRAKAESVYDRGVKDGMRIVFYELEQMEDFEGLQDYIAAYRATDGAEEVAQAASEESGIPESAQTKKPSNNSDAVDFCKRVEKAAKDRAPLELFGVSYEAVGDEPFCETVYRWLHGDAPRECRECPDGKYAELNAMTLGDVDKGIPQGADGNLDQSQVDWLRLMPDGWDGTPPTLGRGTCKDAWGYDPFAAFRCSECGARHTASNKRVIRFCYNCGRKVVDE